MYSTIVNDRQLNLYEYGQGISKQDIDRTITSCNNGVHESSPITITSQAIEGKIVYVGKGYIVYKQLFGSGYLFYKNVYEAGTGNGTQLTAQEGFYPIFVGNNQILYNSASSGFFLKNLSEDYTYGNGTQITTYTSPYYTYVGNGEIVYRYSNNYYYRKNIYEVGTGTGTQITSQTASGVSPLYIGNGEFLYEAAITNSPMFRKNIYEAGTGNGTQITSTAVYPLVYAGKGQAICGGALRLRDVYSFDSYSNVTTQTGVFPITINGELLYQASADHLIYRTTIYNSSDGYSINSLVGQSTSNHVYAGQGLLVGYDSSAQSLYRQKIW